MKEIVKKVLQKAILKSFSFFKEKEIPLEFPKNEQFGDVASSVCLLLSQKLKRPPKEVAERIMRNLSFKDFERVEFKEPGFLNFFFSKKFFLRELRRICQKNWRVKNWGKKKRVLVEFSSPNVAKRFGIGHLRSTIVGEAICRLFEFLGFEVLRFNWLGDWGTQFGKLIFEIEKLKKDPKEMSVAEMENLYVRFHEELKKDPQLEEKGREYFEKLERGEKRVKKIWEVCVKKSKKEFEKIYKLLGVKFDIVEGESFYEKAAKELAEKLKKEGFAKESEGALILEFESLPPAMLRKSDRTTTYFARDLAAAIERIKKFQPDMMVYEVGKEQSLHFQQLFAALNLLGFKNTKFFHLAHGLYLTKEGKISTRKGETFHLETILKEARERAKKLLGEGEVKKISEKEKEKVAEIVGIGALKYNDLKHHPQTDVVFDWQKILNLKGDSGPYLQYTFVRCQSVFRKGKIKDKVCLEKLKIDSLQKEEFDVLKEVCKFEDKILEATQNFSPNILCEYLFSLARKFNLFYEKFPILKAQKEKKDLRLAITKGVKVILETGLDLLSIKVPERM